MSASTFKRLKKEINACKLCAIHLPHGPRPTVQINPTARILIAGQAPGRRVHETGIPFNDPSGYRLRDWMGIERDDFYNEKKIAIVPMGFCYPGTGNSGDLAPRHECAENWRHPVLDALPDIQLTLVIGIYAQAWHLQTTRKKTLTETIMAWESYLPHTIPLPHPSPRNNIWIAKNPWFEKNILPYLKKRICNLI